jgi:hypothetical protein
MRNVIDIRELLLRRKNLRAIQSPEAHRIREEQRLKRLMQGPPRPPLPPGTLGGGFLSENPNRRNPK